MNTIKNMKSKLVLTLMTMLSLNAVNIHAGQDAILPGFEKCVGAVAVQVVHGSAKVAQESVWPVIANNMKVIAVNMWEAAKLVGSFIPGALKQVTHETGLITGAVKKCPIVSAALVTFAAYKAYNWYYADYYNQQNNGHHRR